MAKLNFYPRRQEIFSKFLVGLFQLPGGFEKNQWQN